MSKNLFEGVKFGDKEKQLILKNADDFNVGIEYEFNSNEDNSHKSFEDVIDINQDSDDILRDISNLYDEVDRDLDENLGDTIINLLDTESVGEDIPYGFEEFYKYLINISKDIKKTILPDTETDDMFADDKYRAIVQYLYNAAHKEYGSDYNAIFNMFNSGSLEQKDAYNVMIQIIDIYFEGAFIDGKDENADYLYDLFDAFDNRLYEIFLEDFDVEGFNLNAFKDDIDSLLRLLVSNDFLDKEEDSELPFSISEYGMSNADFSISDYISYIREYGDVEYITNNLIDYVRNEYNEGYLTNSEDTARIDIDYLKDRVSNIDEVKPEHDDMVEVITSKMNVTDAIENIDDMFEYISELGDVRSYAGMHISISTNKYDLDDFDMLKFAILMKLPYVLSYFPERNMVNSLQTIIETNIEQKFYEELALNIVYSKPLSEFIADISAYVSAKLRNEKYQSIKFGDYNFLNGRVELRFFGGEDYHYRKDDILNQLLRALYMLNIGYTDAYKEEYKKTFLKVINDSVMEGTTYSVFYLYKSLNEINKKFNIHYMAHEFNNLSNLDKDEKDEFQTMYIDFMKEMKKYFKGDAESIFEKILRGAK